MNASITYCLPNPLLLAPIFSNDVSNIQYVSNIQSHIIWINLGFIMANPEFDPKVEVL